MEEVGEALEDMLMLAMDTELLRLVGKAGHTLRVVGAQLEELEAHQELLGLLGMVNFVGQVVEVAVETQVELEVLEALVER